MQDSDSSSEVTDTGEIRRFRRELIKLLAAREKREKDIKHARSEKTNDAESEANSTHSENGPQEPGRRGQNRTFENHAVGNELEVILVNLLVYEYLRNDLVHPQRAKGKRKTTAGPKAGRGDSSGKILTDKLGLEPFGLDVNALVDQFKDYFGSALIWRHANSNWLTFEQRIAELKDAIDADRVKRISIQGTAAENKEEVKEQSIAQSSTPASISDSTEKTRKRKKATSSDDYHEKLKEVLEEAAKAQKLLDACLRFVESGLSIQPGDHEPVITIRLGCGMALVPRFVPEVIREFRRDASNQRHQFNVQITQDTSHNLRQKTDSGEFDLVVTSFSDDDAKIHKGTLHIGKLDMHVLFDRLHEPPLVPKTITKTEDFEKLIANKRVIQSGYARSPSLRISSKLLTKAQSVVDTNVWFEALAMIKSNNDTCCLAFPQIFPPDQRSRYHEFRLSSEEFVKLHLGVMRCKGGRESLSPDKESVVQGLYDKFASIISSLERENTIQHHKSILPTELTRTAHLTLHKEGQHCWTLGRLTECAISPDGYIRATHILEDRDGSRFSINGHVSLRSITTSSPQTVDWRRFIVWRGYEEHLVDNDVNKEVYSASLSSDISDVGENDTAAPMVGVWAGRATFQNTPYVGYFILYDKRMQERFSRDNVVNHVELAAEFSRLIHLHKEKHKVQLAFPEKVDPPR